MDFGKAEAGFLDFPDVGRDAWVHGPAAFELGILLAQPVKGRLAVRRGAKIGALQRGFLRRGVAWLRGGEDVHGGVRGGGGGRSGEEGSAAGKATGGDGFPLGIFRVEELFSGLGVDGGEGV